MKINLLIFVFIVLGFAAFTQPPQAINYQGVARDSMGHPLINKNISLQLSILDSSATGQAIYVETHLTLTSSSGLFNIYIGNGNVIVGDFSTVPWGQGSKWLKVEMDVTGGSSFQLIGASQFMSVPYALYSKNGISGNANAGDMIYYNGTCYQKTNMRRFRQIGMWCFRKIGMHDFA
jgi:hypothetical protein